MIPSYLHYGSFLFLDVNIYTIMHNNVSVNNRPYIQRWSHQIIMKLKIYTTMVLSDYNGVEDFLSPSNFVAVLSSHSSMHFSLVCGDAGKQMYCAASCIKLLDLPLCYSFLQ